MQQELIQQGLVRPRLIRPRLIQRWRVWIGVGMAVAAALWSHPSPVVAQTVPPAPARAAYVIQLQAPAAAEVYAALTAPDQLTAAEAAIEVAAATAATQAHLAQVDLAQQTLLSALAAHDAQVLYRTQRVYNGIAVLAAPDQVDALAALPGVAAVYPLIPKTPDNAKVNVLLNLPRLWQGVTRGGLTGAGVKVAVIDTGIDYLHAMFGGPATATDYARNDTTLLGDVPNFPGIKVAGGYDFTGDTYDANPASLFYQPIPQPDPDPMDCYGFGHGTHVAGTLAGYGVRAGAAWPGPYDTSLDPTSFDLAPGVAPQATLYALKVFGCSGSSDVVDAAVEWAVDPNQDGDFSDRMDVINLSLGASFGIAYDSTVVAVENAAKLGIIVVASAGNTGDAHYSTGSPSVADATLAVAASDVLLQDSQTARDGELASFSARGPRRLDHALKPDISAPGVRIVSARRGTGTQGATSSGTSMASPVVAGVMALLRQAYPEQGAPGWSARELKALVMNTAAYPLSPSTMPPAPYSLLRMGAGRVDPTAALQSHLIAYDADAPDRVSVSFGRVPVGDETYVVRMLEVANKSAQPITATVGYVPVRTLPGVSVEVPTGAIITVPPFDRASVAVTLRGRAADLARLPDPARQSTPDGTPWLDEVGGYVTFTPAAAQGVPIHVAVHALPHAVSQVSLSGAPLDFTAAPNGAYPYTVTGGTLPAAAAPTSTVPMIGLFQLLTSSPPISAGPLGDPNPARYAHADLRHVGIAGPVEVDGEMMVYFALVTYGAWSTPTETSFVIEMDVNDDHEVDYRLMNREAGDVNLNDTGYSDDFVSLLEGPGQVRAIQGPLNVLPATDADPGVFDNNVMILPLRVADLGHNVGRVRFAVVGYSADVASSTLPPPVDRTRALTWDVARSPGLIVHGPSQVLAQALAQVLARPTLGQGVVVEYELAEFLRQPSIGLLVVHLHNRLETRAQVLPIRYAWPHQGFLPYMASKQQ